MNRSICLLLLLLFIPSCSSGAAREAAFVSQVAATIYAEETAAVALTPNWEVLLTTKWEGSIQLWNTASLQPACTLIDDYRDFQYGYFDEPGVRLITYHETAGLSVWGIP